MFIVYQISSLFYITFPFIFVTPQKKKKEKSDASTTGDSYTKKVCYLYDDLTRKDQIFMRPPSPPDTNASPSGLKATVRTGVICPRS